MNFLAKWKNGKMAKWKNAPNPKSQDFQFLTPPWDRGFPFPAAKRVDSDTSRNPAKSQERFYVGE